MVSLQIVVPENFNFNCPEEWPQWIQKFEHFCQASSLHLKGTYDGWVILQMTYWVWGILVMRTKGSVRQSSWSLTNILQWGEMWYTSTPNAIATLKTWWDSRPIHDNLTHTCWKLFIWITSRRRPPSSGLAWYASIHETSAGPRAYLEANSHSCLIEWSSKTSAVCDTKSVLPSKYRWSFVQREDVTRR